MNFESILRRSIHSYFNPFEGWIDLWKNETNEITLQKWLANPPLRVVHLTKRAFARVKNCEWSLVVYSLIHAYGWIRSSFLHGLKFVRSKLNSPFKKVEKVNWPSKEKYNLVKSFRIWRRIKDQANRALEKCFYWIRFIAWVPDWNKTRLDTWLKANRRRDNSLSLIWRGSIEIYWWIDNK